MAQQTIRDFVEECKCYEYSTEYYNLMKEASEIDLMEKYLENQEFALENAEFINVEGGYSFTEGMFIESSSVDLNQSYYLMEKKDKKKSGFFATIWKAIKRLFEKIANFFKKLFGAAQKSRSAKKEADKIWKKIGGEKKVKEWIKKHHGVEGAVDKIGTKTDNEEVRRHLASKVRKLGEEQQKEKDEAVQKQINDLKDKLQKTRKSLAKAIKENRKDEAKKLKNEVAAIEEQLKQHDVAIEFLDDRMDSASETLAHFLAFAKTRDGLTINNNFAELTYEYVADIIGKSIGNTFSEQHSNANIVYGFLYNSIDEFSNAIANGDTIRIKVKRYFGESDSSKMKSGNKDGLVLTISQIKKIFDANIARFHSAVATGNSDTQLRNINNKDNTKAIDNLTKALYKAHEENVTKGFDFPSSLAEIKKASADAKEISNKIANIISATTKFTDADSASGTSRNAYPELSDPNTSQEDKDKAEKDFKKNVQPKTNELREILTILNMSTAELVKFNTAMEKYTSKYADFIKKLAFEANGAPKKTV